MEHIQLIRKIAWSFHKTTGLEWEELFAEASLYYCRALTTYDPTRGQKLTTYVWRSISCELINYIKKNQKISDNYSSLEIEKLWNRPWETTPFKTSSVFEALTKEAQEIVALILALPERFSEDTPKQAQKHIVNILKERGWKKDKIEAAMKNIKIAFN